MNAPDNLLDMHPLDAQARLADWLRAEREPAYRARQIMPRLWRRPVPSWADATDLPSTLRSALDETFPLSRPRLVTRQVSQDGTIKYLWDFGERGAVESVLIPEGRRRTLCISSQAGCAYGCVFCATGRMGFVRHLAPWEIASQVRELRLGADGTSPTNVVFMGMGEPLHNWAGVDRALGILNHPAGLGIGARLITVSTIGIIPNLERLAARNEQFRVAWSLHAADSGTRRTLMPVERKYPMADVLPVLARFARRVTFEYVMIAGVNDRPEDARRLAAIARPLGALVNLLPLHPGGAPGYTPTPVDEIAVFAERLRAERVNATVRRSRGLDISAACGQLRVEVEHAPRIAPHDHAHVQQ